MFSHVFSHRFSCAVRDGYRGPAAGAADQAGPHAHVQDPAEHRQPRGVQQGAAHAGLQRLPEVKLRGRQTVRGRG